MECVCYLSLTECFEYAFTPPPVYVKDVEQLFEINEGGALLLMVPIRLGGESLNPIYIPCVQVH